jgi:hypothetical protein
MPRALLTPPTAWLIRPSLLDGLVKSEREGSWFRMPCPLAACNIRQTGYRSEEVPNLLLALPREVLGVARLEAEVGLGRARELVGLAGDSGWFV